MSRIFLLTFLFIIKTWASEEPGSALSFSLSYLESLMEKLVRLEIKLDAVERELKSERELRLSQQQQLERLTSNVAFRVHLSSNLNQITSGTIIKFDNVQLNIGRAYNESNGTFTAPLNGTYLFAMVLGNPAGNPGACFLKKNGDVIGYTIAGHTTGWNTGGMTTVAQLVKGDAVWVAGETHAAGTYATTRHHSSFSGILVHAD